MKHLNWPAFLPPVVSLDLEGNGQSPVNIIEVGIVPLLGNGPAQGQSWQVCPPKPVTYHATRVHGITNHTLAGSPKWEGIASEVEEALTGKWMIGHNGAGDYAILRRHLPNWQPAGLIDTLRLSKSVVPGLAAYSLDALCDQLGLNKGVSGVRHRALPDALAAAALFAYLLERGRFSGWREVCARGQVVLATAQNPVSASPGQQSLW